MKKISGIIKSYFSSPKKSPPFGSGSNHQVEESKEVRVDDHKSNKLAKQLILRARSDILLEERKHDSPASVVNKNAGYFPRKMNDNNSFRPDPGNNSNLSAQPSGANFYNGIAQHMADVDIPTEYEDAAKRIQSFFRGEQARKASKYSLLKELEEILKKSAQFTDFSVTAIISFLSSRDLEQCTPEQNEYYRKNFINTEWAENFPQSKGQFLKTLETASSKLGSYFDTEYDYRVICLFDMISKNHKTEDNVNKYGFSDYSKLRDKIESIYSVKHLLRTGIANCGLQAAILRTFLIKTLPPDILEKIGSINIQVSTYKYIDHEFVVIKNFYGEDNIPKNHLVMDTWTQHLYLPEKKGYRRKPAFPTSHRYYSKLLKNIADPKVSPILSNFPNEGSFNDEYEKDRHSLRRGFMGNLEEYHKFLIDHADGFYVALEDRHVSGVSESIPIDYFETAELTQEETYYKDTEYLYDIINNWELGERPSRKYLKK